MSAVISPSSPAIDLAAVKTRQRAAWATGDYAVVGTTLRIVGEIIVAAIQAAGAIVRRVRVRRRQRRQAMAAYDALRQLDDRTLHDIGFHRSEIISVAAEISAGARRTRVRTQRL